MDWRFFGVGIALTTVGVGILAVDLAKRSHGSSDDDSDAPGFAGFDAKATLKSLQGTWLVDPSDGTYLSIDGSTATRIGWKPFEGAKLAVHSPCSFAVTRDDGTYDLAFAMTPTGPRFDDIDGIDLGSTQVICTGTTVAVLQGGRCTAWTAILGDKWEHDDDEPCAYSRSGDTVTFTSGTDETDLKVDGKMLYPANADPITPQKLASIDAALAAEKAKLEKQKEAVSAAGDPDTLVQLANQAGQDLAGGLDVKLAGYVDHLEPDSFTFYVRTAKDASGDDALVECDATGGTVKPGKPVTLSGTIITIEADKVTLSPCGVPKKGHPG